MGDADGLTDQPGRTDASQLPEVSEPPVVSEPPAVVTNESNEGGTATPQPSQPATPKTPPPLAREQVDSEINSETLGTPSVLCNSLTAEQNAFAASGQSDLGQSATSAESAAEPKAVGIPAIPVEIQVEIPASGPETKRARVEQAAVQAAAPEAPTARKSEPPKPRRPRAPKAVVGKDGQSGIAKFSSVVTPAPLALQPRPAAAAGPMVPPGRVAAPRGRGSGKAAAISAQPASGQAPGSTPGRPGSLLNNVHSRRQAKQL